MILLSFSKQGGETMLLTMEEAMKILRISRPTLAKHAQEFGGFKIGAQWRFDSRALEKQEDKKNEEER